MARAKYRFNTRTLSYEKIELDWRKRIFRASTFLIASTFLGFIIYFTAAAFIDSPKEKLLKRENNQLKSQYNLLDHRMERASAVLEDIQRRDDDIYRAIFEAEPIPDEIRKAGFGGVNRYKKLEGYKNSMLVIEGAKKLDHISKELYIQSKSFDEVYQMAIRKEKMLASIPAIQPISNTDLRRVASGFGIRMHPIYKRKIMHTGMDLSATTGTKIYATGDGVIESAIHSNRGYGNHVTINHGYGYETLYGHMNRFIVRRGEKVKRGQIIGYVGNTGSSVGSHVHYEVIKDGKKINPINFYYNDLTPAEYEKMVDIASRPTQSFD